MKPPALIQHASRGVCHVQAPAKGQNVRIITNASQTTRLQNAWAAGGASPLLTRRFASKRAASLKPNIKATATPSASRAQQSRTPPPPRPPPSGSSQASQPPPSHGQTLDKLFQQRKYALVGAGFTALGMGLLVSLLINAYLKTPPDHSHHDGADDASQLPTGRPPSLTRQTAAAFDAELDWPEWLMGLTRLRRRLARQARGHVLEVCVGTGRNLRFYDWNAVVAAEEDEQAREHELRRSRLRALLDRNSWAGIREGQADGSLPGEVLSFTGVDVSGDVLDVARQRVRTHVPGAKRLLRSNTKDSNSGEPVSLFSGRLRLLQQDAQTDPLPPPPATTSTGAAGRKRYDTIVETFGLCSVPDPVGLVARLAGLVEPGSGRIVLLEHGRGWAGAVNDFLDRHAGRHFERYGCWWNRDIERVVGEAAARVPGLEVVKLERPYLTQFGTTLWIELKVVDPTPSAVKSTELV